MTDERLNGWCSTSIAIGLSELKLSLECNGVDVKPLTDYGLLMQAIAFIEASWGNYKLIESDYPNINIYRQKLPPTTTHEEMIEFWRVDRQRYYKCAWWKHTRQAAIERANSRCEHCESIYNLQVHHLTYERLGKEIPEDLQVLCFECHRQAHSKEGLQPHDQETQT
jgi:hypothetical protein